MAGQDRVHQSGRSIPWGSLHKVFQVPSSFSEGSVGLPPISRATVVNRQNFTGGNTSCKAPGFVCPIFSNAAS